MRDVGGVVLVCGGERNASRLSGFNSKEKKLFGRPRQKWEAIIKMDVMWIEWARCSVDSFGSGQRRLDDTLK
jgi:hypothetical protein